MEWLKSPTVRGWAYKNNKMKIPSDGFDEKQLTALKVEVVVFDFSKDYSADGIVGPS